MPAPQHQGHCGFLHPGDKLRQGEPRLDIPTDGVEQDEKTLDLPALLDRH